MNTTPPVDLFLFTPVTDANYAFALRIFDNIDSASNIFSPLALIMGLTTIHLGALGRTNNQLTDILGTKYEPDDLQRYTDLFDPLYISLRTLLLTNDTHIDRRYLNLANQISRPISVPNSSSEHRRTRINQWIGRYSLCRTSGIEGLRPSPLLYSGNAFSHTLEPADLPPAHALTLVTTCTIHTLWLTPFNPALTYTTPFGLTIDETVNMMVQTTNANYYTDPNVQLIELPLTDTDCVFGIVLPADQTDAIEYTINRVPLLTPGALAEYINNAQQLPVSIHIPRFTLRQHSNLKPILQKLGLFDMFDHTAQLHAIAPNTFVEGLVHEAMIVVDEGCTDDYLQTEADLKPEATFVANRSFIYYVRYVPDDVLLAYGDYHGHDS